MLSRHLRTHLIVAPSTSVGKSIFSTGLVRASLALGEKVAYLKPVGTGSGDGDDELHLQRFAPQAKTACLFHFDEPVSPHLAVERSAAGLSKAVTKAPTDAEFAAAVGKYARSFAEETAGKRSSLYIETAGGVHSPTLCGTSQLDAFRPLLPPTLLVASAALGGISTTISAYESLMLRGYDVDAVLVFREEYYANYQYFEKWFTERGIRVGVVDQPPEQVTNAAEDAANLEAYYSKLAGSPLQRIVQRLQQIHLDRMSNLATAPRRTLDKVWWPFVQHGLVQNESDVMVIDSAHGDHFSVFATSSPPVEPPTPSSDPSAAPVVPPSQQATSTTAATPSSPPAQSPAHPLLSPVFDGSASWWTQCLGHANPELTLAAAHASGRFGHVMFPTATNLPALELAEKLLATVGEGWADRVFFSDDGSTGMEVALKMALRAYADRERLSPAEGRRLAVLGLKGSYHGDTIGAMDACEGGVYSERVEWYEGRGYWLAAPEVRIEQGKVVVRGKGGRATSYDSLTQLYDVDRRVRDDELARVYREEIEGELQKRLDKGDGIRFGALVLEPVVMGAGGMIFVDPLYQRVLIDVVRTNRQLFPAASPAPSDSATLAATGSTPVWQGLPVIFDEVFVGLHRLGRTTASTFLGSSTKPDIACYAKILTGGLVPMAVTLASDAIFRAFWSDKKVDALLHGHSYTAHAVGCGVANKTLAILDRMEKQGVYDGAKQDWATAASSAEGGAASGVWSLWSSSFVQSVSSHPAVDGVMAIGTVLAIHLKAGDGAGYQSTASETVLRQLRFGAPFDSDPAAAASPSGAPFHIHARPLGNVIYFMSSLNSSAETLRSVEGSIVAALDAKAGAS
ncbi:hypothetical protein NBRC10513v2_006505 [Rhodotorula toruloides]|uniref:Pyridoxal phosphate-dependent transferase n=1 Tax=Rhodotorula toruloides TaxID=5286 RepID=A0A0K3CAL6_RHOTO|nr:Pyridoxal phosphate-dependent transferase [Rhodotorula toruloides]